MKSLETMIARIADLTDTNRNEISELYRQRDSLNDEAKQLEADIPKAVEAGQREHYKELKSRLSDVKFDLSYIKSRLEKLEHDPLIARDEYNRLSKAVLDESKAATAEDKTAIMAAVDTIREVYTRWSQRISQVNTALGDWQRGVYREETDAVKCYQEHRQPPAVLKDSDFGIGEFWRALEEITPKAWKRGEVRE